MIKVKLTTTLEKLSKYWKDSSSYGKLIKSLPKGYPLTKPINLLHILTSNGAQDTMWALRAATPNEPQIRVAICADIAKRKLPVFEAQYPHDSKPRECIQACYKYVRGEIGPRALRKAADACAISTDYFTSSFVVSYAAYSAYLAARAISAVFAADCAVYAAATDSISKGSLSSRAANIAINTAKSRRAYIRERKAQARIIRKYLR